MSHKERIYTQLFRKRSFCYRQVWVLLLWCFPSLSLPLPPLCGHLDRMSLKFLSIHTQSYYTIQIIGRAQPSECAERANNPSVRNMHAGHGWYFLHCAAGNAWCKPCATKGLVYNPTCGQCEASRDGPCSSDRKFYAVVRDDFSPN